VGLMLGRHLQNLVLTGAKRREWKGCLGVAGIIIRSFPKIPYV
jgi:hypothetical protein